MKEMLSGCAKFAKLIDPIASEHHNIHPSDDKIDLGTNSIEKKIFAKIITKVQFDFFVVTF